MTESLKVNDGHVVSLDYTLHVDGKVVDSSEGGEPLQFIQGMGHIIPGLENGGGDYGSVKTPGSRRPSQI